MVRLAILLVLLGFTIWEWRSGEHKPVYWLSMAFLFVFFSLRYGQGTDYLTYLSIYANVPPLTQFPNYFAFQYNKIEIGFYYFMSFFRTFGVHYVLFVAIVTFLSLACLHRFIKKFCPLPMFALTFFFAVYSLTYMESALRQMLALSIAMGWVFIDWVNGKRFRPMIGIALASTLHTSAALLFLLPVLFWYPRPLYLIEWKPKKIAAVLFALLAATAVINFVDLTPLIKILPARLEYTISYYYVKQLNLMAVLNRSLFMAIVFALTYRAREQLSDREKLLFNLYCVGYGLYLLFMSFDLIASRTNINFRVVDICLIPLLFYKNRDLVKRTFVGMPVMLLLVSFLYVKDMTAIMDFSQYYSGNPLDYPYITVFNTDELLDNKFVNIKNAQAMNAYQTGGFSWDEYYHTLQRKPSVRSPIVPY